jgi:DNA-binding transcriptional MocR family regulator
MRETWAGCLNRAMGEPAAWDTAPRTGVPALREALAAHLAVAAEDLSVTSGIRGQVAALLSGARTLVVERPTFLSVPRLAARYVTVLALDWAQILASGADLPAGSVIWITSPARNPDGRTLTVDEARRLDELAERHRVVVNQAYYWCAPHAPRPARAHLVGSLHKLSGGGCALGWEVTPGGRGPDRPAAGGPPAAWQSAWAELISTTGLAEPIRRCLLDPSERCRTAARALQLPSGAELRYGGGPSLSLLLPPGVTEARAHAALAAEGLRTGLGSDFGWDRPALRLSFTAVADDEVARCADGVRQAFARLGLS